MFAKSNNSQKILILKDDLEVLDFPFDVTETP